jgi:molybdopterin-guanine dinucleotide biosynthesis protein
MEKNPPIIVGVGGAFSGVGKTTVACSILRGLKGWGAIKYTKILLNSVLVDDRGMLAKRGKDTALMLECGAERVIWLRSPRFRLRGIVLEAVSRLSDLEGIVVEGNSAVSLLKPDIVVFVAGGATIKRGAEGILAMADIVLYGERPPEGGKESARLLWKDDAGFQPYILDLIDDIKAKKVQPPT